jgi:DNA-binding NarL/FixJ family response regulator
MTPFVEACLSFFDLQEDMELVGLAQTGKQAVELVHRVHPDIVVIDARTPVMSGAEATCEIRQNFPETKVIRLTCFEANDTILNLLNAGADLCVVKAVSIDELAEAIKDVVYSRNSELNLGTVTGTGLLIRSSVKRYSF